MNLFNDLRPYRDVIEFKLFRCKTDKPYQIADPSSMKTMKVLLKTSQYDRKRHILKAEFHYVLNYALEKLLTYYAVL